MSWYFYLPDNMRELCILRHKTVVQYNAFKTKSICVLHINYSQDVKAEKSIKDVL